MAKPAARPSSKRPPLPRVSDEVRVISEFLLNELLSWPKTSAKPMFGLRAVYHGRAIFAALPATRALSTSCSVSFKLQAKTPAILKSLESDDRIVTSELKMANWFSYEIRSDRDIPDAIAWFAKAYEQAGKPTSAKPRAAAKRR
jgi:hypothetical protein